MTFPRFNKHGDWTTIKSMTEINATRMEESIAYLMDFLNKKEEPYDGFIGYCEGYVYLTYVLRVMKYC